MIPLAEQKKSLEEKIEELFKRETFKIGISSKSFDDLLLDGENSIYRYNTSPIGAPKGAYRYGTVITINPTHSKISDYGTIQIYVADGTGGKDISDKSIGVFVRSRPNQNWVRLGAESIEQKTE